MSFDLDQDILQDFLVEAGEILEQLQEQLVELENDPNNADLLNAIFRGYHTVKGGAGFLSLTELVDVCHGAENIFDVMRNGQRTLTPALMDLILQATDVVVQMFDEVKSGQPISPADSGLIQQLHKFSQPETDGEVIDVPPSPITAEAAVIPQQEAVTSKSPISEPLTSGGSIDEITEDEFEALLDELHGSGPVSAPFSEPTEAQQATASDEANTSSSNDDLISDDEFENLLDEIHGAGQFSTPSSDAKPESEPVANANQSEAKAETQSANSQELITDDEFDALLDELHGSGKGPSAVKAQNISPSDKPDGVEQIASTDNATPAPSTSDTSASSKPGVKKAQGAKVAKAAPKKSQTKPAAKSATQAPAAETTVRVDTKRLDKIMNMVGELVLVRNRLLSLGVNVEDEHMSKAIGNLDVVTGDLQGAVMKTRMQPIKKVFGRFPRVVRDLARALDKDISLNLRGEETDLDKNLVEALADPLVHLVRNSVDHGIELPAEREAAGKPRTGQVTLAAAQEGDHILLTIEDDGKGMDAEKLKSIAIERGVIDHDQASRMLDQDAFNLIFAPGFSTKTEISDISGRGVGMDVVKTKITQLNGAIDIHSELGVGTRLQIKVPLTLAILPTLMIIVGKQTFALPLAAVNEIINLELKKTNTVDGQLTMIVRERAIPLFYLSDWLKPKEPRAADLEGHVVVVQIGNQQVGFVVDALIGQEEVVIKPLDALLQGTPGMAGATITSDGGIALILDIPSMLSHYAKRS